MSKSLKGREGFESYYGAIYKDRWPSLRDSLLKDPRQVARINAFVEPRHLSVRLEAESVSQFSGLKVVDRPEIKSLSAKPDSNSIHDFYIMDAASLLPPVALDVQEGDEVLDLCAAPGGKSLVLAEKVGESGKLVVNELSDRRRARLRAVLDDYIPQPRRGRINVSNHDGTRWCLYETDAFDRILLDAPCSGERHLLANADEMSQWSQARSKNLAVRQYALLASALAVVRPGGRIVYSTCSISPLEDDDVVARLLKKRKGEAEVIRMEFEIGEPTEYGWIVLPDRADGFGPIYLAVVQRA